MPERAGALLAVALAMVLLASPPRARAASDAGCGVSAIPVREGAGVYHLPHGFIRAGSDSVWTRRGALTRGTDYVLDRLRGELRLLGRVPAGETLWAAGCWLIHPPPIDLQINHYRPLALAAPESAKTGAIEVPVRPATHRDPGTAPAGAALSVNGNKTIAIEFGSSQDAFLRQSLDLAVSGTLAPGVTLTGALSDRNTPLTSSGSTQDLQALDRVLIELRTPQASAALGDVTLSIPHGDFGRIERRLQGVRGEWGVGGFQGTVAAASAQGEYRRLQLFGVEGRQGPYVMTDRDGNPGVSVVAGSEVVTVDGARMTRGESADYSMDYERGQLTFSNRRPISSASRITVEYQFAVNRYRRNLAAFDGRWEGKTIHGFTRLLSEGDDRGRPLDITLDAQDRLALAYAGDSLGRALGPGVTAGGGDYDTVRVAGVLIYAFARPDSGRFAVRFARVGQGLGSYADSASIAGRIAYKYVGPGSGAFVIGRALPLPESHQLWAGGGGVRLGALTLETEGAVSRQDLNVYSPIDDGDNVGHAGRAALAIEGAAPGALGHAGLSVTARAVDRRFAPFTRLERPFAQEDWGLPVDADLEHQHRLEAAGFVKPRFGGDLRATLARLDLPGGFTSLRRGLDWTRDGMLATQLAIERADARDPHRRFRDGGRERARGELRLRTAWLEPALRGEFDARRVPSDSVRVGARVREGTLELASARRFAWHAVAGYGLRRDALRSATGFDDQSEARTLRFALDGPPGGPLGLALAYQRRDLEPLASPVRTRSELASTRLRYDDAKRGLSASASLEVTAEGENRRVRTLTFVGSGQGPYDALGNFVGRGDYVLGIGVSDALERVARTALSARMAWQFGESEAWRGSRAEFDFETDARRRGEFRPGDALVSPGAVLADASLARGSVLQRLDTEIAPDSRAGALRLLIERRVSADRSFDNFGQSQDERTVSLRWRARPGAVVSTEVEARLRRQEAAQLLLGVQPYRRVLLENGGTAQLVVTPDARLRAVGALEASWVRPEDQNDVTRTVRVGPDLGFALGARGRLELGARRTFVSGPPVAGLLPTADPLAPPHWEGNARMDYRVRETTTLGVSFNARDVPHAASRYTGRAELRAFF